MQGVCSLQGYAYAGVSLFVTATTADTTIPAAKRLEDVCGARCPIGKGRLESAIEEAEINSVDKIKLACRN
jgi:hypothetical protein